VRLVPRIAKPRQVTFNLSREDLFSQVAWEAAAAASSSVHAQKHQEQGAAKKPFLARQAPQDRVSICSEQDAKRWLVPGIAHTSGLEALLAFERGVQRDSRPDPSLFWRWLALAAAPFLGPKVRFNTAGAKWFNSVLTIDTEAKSAFCPWQSRATLAPYTHKGNHLCVSIAPSGKMWFRCFDTDSCAEKAPKFLVVLNIDPLELFSVKKTILGFLLFFVL
jgi:hypothetical protein